MVLKAVETSPAPKRMRNRVYVFVVSALAAALVTLALVKPALETQVARATISVPAKTATHINHPTADRIRSFDFQRGIGTRIGITAGADGQLAANDLDQWVSALRRSLVVTELPVELEGAEHADIAIEYRGPGADQSLAVLQALLDGLMGENEVATIADTSSANRSRIRLLEQRLNTEIEALDAYVEEEVSQLRLESKMFAEEPHTTVSLHETERLTNALDTDRDVTAGTDLSSPNRSPFAQIESPVGTTNDWLAAQNEIDRENGLVRNPEYDTFVRSLVKVQAERQRLLIQFDEDHAAVRRVESEINKLELLISHTNKYLNDRDGFTTPTTTVGVAPRDSNEVASASGYATQFDAAQAAATVRQTEVYEMMAKSIQGTERELESLKATAPNRSGGLPSTVEIIHPPSLTTVGDRRLPWSKTLVVAGISSLIGFVMSRFDESIRTPKVLHSDADVRDSLNIPIVGRLEMDRTPKIPSAERVASVAFRRFSIRLAEFAVLLMLVSFAVALLLQQSSTAPLTISDAISTPITTYVQAFQHLRDYVPVPYLL